MKVFCVSDIHIDEYPSIPNISEERFHAPLKLAEKLVRDGKKDGVDTLFVLGDILNKPRPLPKVVGVMTEFGKIISSHFTKVYYILGQHDLINRYDEENRHWSKSTTTYVGLLNELFHWEYSNNRIIELDGRKILMTDYGQPEPKKKVDVWLGHTTLGFGTQLKGGTYTIGIHGDIHEIVDNYKGTSNYSCGSPYQISREQMSLNNGEGTYVVLDLDTLSMKRVNTSDEYHTFYKLPKEDVKIENKDTSKIREKVYINEDLTSYVPEELLPYYNELDHSHIQNMINYNFIIENVKISNYRSIEYLELDKEQLSGITLIHGLNGSGKSSIISAIYHALLGGKIQDNSTSNSSGCSLSITIEYEGTKYTIERNPGDTLFYKNGENINKENKTETERFIYQSLPFLNNLELFRIRPNSHVLDYLDLSGVLKSTFSLDQFDNYAWQCKEKSKVEKYNQKEIQGSINILNEQIKEFPEFLKEPEKVEQEEVNKLRNIMTERNIYERELSELGEISLTEEENNLDIKYELRKNYDILRIKDELSKIKKEYSDEELLANDKEYQKLLNESNLLLNEVKRIRKDYDLVSNELLRIPKFIEGELCENCGHRNKKENPLWISTESKKITLYDTFTNKSSYYEELTLRINSMKEDILKRNRINPDWERLNKELSELGEIRYSNELLNKIEKEKSKSIKYNELKEKLSKLPELKEDDIIQLENKLNLWNMYVQKGNLEGKLFNQKKLLEESIKRESKFKELKELFDIENSESIPYKKLYSIAILFEELLPKWLLVKMDRELKNGKKKFDFHIEAQTPSGNILQYSTLSDGQKCIVDLYILSTLLQCLGSCLGFLAIDEGLANLDSEKYGIAESIITNIPVNTLLISTHSPDFSYKGKSIMTELVDERTEVRI